MTKRRAPLSIDAALTEIAAVLGWEGMAETVGKSPSYLRRCGDPDCREQLALRDARTLDIAFRNVGGRGTPLHAWYAGGLDAAGALAPASDAALLSQSAEVIRECAEAEAALVVAALPGAGPRESANARRELEEAVASLHRAISMLPDGHAARARIHREFAPEDTHPSTGPPH